jgi:hypothetical protein
MTQWTDGVAIKPCRTDSALRGALVSPGPPRGLPADSKCAVTSTVAVKSRLTDGRKRHIAVQGVPGGDASPVAGNGRFPAHPQ